MGVDCSASEPEHGYVYCAYWYDYAVWVMLYIRGY